MWGSHRPVSGFQIQHLLEERGIPYAWSALLRIDLFKSMPKKKSKIKMKAEAPIFAKLIDAAGKT